MLPLQNLISTISGHEDLFSLEHRIFNISSFFITTLGVLGGAANFLIGLNQMVVWLSAAGALVSFALFYLGRIKRHFSAGIVIFYVFAAIAILGSMYFYNGGLSGTTFYIQITLLHIFLLVIPVKHQFSVYLLMYLNLSVLILLEHLHPEWVIDYHSPEERMLDHVVTLFYALFYSVIVILTFRMSYIKEKQKTEEQNIRLVSMNGEIGRQRESLENKTLQLEEAVKVARERHEYNHILLRELNHRVKNNLQVISSLLNLQAHSIQDENARKAILEGKNRLLSMILVHQRLYQNENSTKVCMADYLKELAETIMYTYSGIFDEETVEYEIEPIWLDVESAIPLGLICNELISNAFKHAFKDSPDPYLFIKLQNLEKFYLLEIADNGPGWNGKSAVKTFGMDLVNSLVKQLNGKLTLVGTKGTRFSILFSKSRREGFLV